MYYYYYFSWNIKIWLKERQLNQKFLTFRTPKLLTCSYQTPHPGCQGLSKHWVVSGFLWPQRRHGRGWSLLQRGLKARLLSPNFLLPRLHPLQSSRLWGLMAGGRGLSHPVWGCINSILVFPNCCLYQVLGLQLTSEPWPADRYFLSKTRIVRSVLCYQ